MCETRSYVHAKFGYVVDPIPMASAIVSNLRSCRSNERLVVPSQPVTSLWTAVLPTDRRQLKTCDSRADEISSFQPILLGSHDEIIMHVHGTSV